MLKMKPIFDLSAFQFGQIFLVTDKTRPEKKLSFHGFITTIEEEKIVLSCYKPYKTNTSRYRLDDVSITPDKLDETKGVYELQLITNPPEQLYEEEQVLEPFQFNPFPKPSLEDEY